MRIGLRKPISSIALINPLGDFGINQYSHELAEGLGANDVRVGFYTSSDHDLPAPVHYFRYPVLSSVLVKQRSLLASPTRPGADTSTDPDWLQHALDSTTREPCPRKSPVVTPLPRLRKISMTLELAAHLKGAGYDVIWTQWPELGCYEPWFRPFCQRLGMRVVHTVHNVFPHDVVSEFDKQLCGRVYRDSELLFLHSHQARSAFLYYFPSLASRTRVTPLGLYTMYPRRQTERKRLRAALEIGRDELVVVFAGAVRPYKGVDTVVEALGHPGCEALTLIVAGVESNYPDLVPGLPLGRTAALALKFGVSQRVKLIPRHLSIGEMSELFELADIQALPYLGGYGSAMVLLGMTFGKYIVSTRVGGAEEYLADYPYATLLASPNVSDVAKGLADAVGSLRSGKWGVIPQLPHLQWKNIAREALAYLDHAVKG